VYPRWLYTQTVDVDRGAGAGIQEHHKTRRPCIMINDARCERRLSAVRGPYACLLSVSLVSLVSVSPCVRAWLSKKRIEFESSEASEHPHIRAQAQQQVAAASSSSWKSRAFINGR